MSNNSQIRDTLFGDLPLEQWTGNSPETTSSERWASFARAKQLIGSGNKAAATSALQSVLQMPELESRHYLQACHFLRGLGVKAAPEHAKDVFGVVVEVGLEQGLDLLAAYPDHHARYYNFSGAGVIWERPNDTLDASIDALLRACTLVAQAIGPWDGAKPTAPTTGNVRINILAASGLHLG